MSGSTAGDPTALRMVARALRERALQLDHSLARLIPAIELRGNRGAAMHRVRDTVMDHRERGSRVVGRLEVLAAELDRGAAWVEQASLDAAARGEP